MTSGIKSRHVTVTDDPQDYRSPRSSSFAFVVRGDDPVAVLDSLDADFDDAGKIQTGETAKFWNLKDRDTVILACGSGLSSAIEILEGGVG